MAKSISFNFGANAKPRKAKAGKSGKSKRSGKASTSNASKSNAWRAYIGSAPIPD